ncbi:MAG: hypothetical protein KF831_04880 [Acidobacteria bacterium]|nr:hypothetical protein [Acidobacteriota bacterium]
MLKNLKGTIAIAAFALAVMALPTVASAQWRDRDRDRNDDYYGRGSYNRNIRGTLENLKNRARNFERTTDRIEDRRNDRRDDRDDRWGRRDRNDRNDRWGGRDRNDRWGGNWGGRNGNVSRLEDLADRFRRATDDLRDEYGNGRNLNGSRDEARRVLDLGREIEQEMRSVRVSRQAQNEWNRIRQDLNVVAQVYGYGYNNRGNFPRNRGGFPWPF